MEKRRALQIIVPVVIVFIIASLWLFKNYPERLAADRTGKTPLDSAARNVADGDLSGAIPLKLTSVDLGSITEREMPAIIDFGADACIPCKEMAPVLVKLNAEMQQKASIHFVDVWKSPQAAEGFPVQVIPTQVFINADGSPYVPSEGMNIPFTLYSTRESNEHVFTVHQGGLSEEQMRVILRDMGAL